MELKAQKHLVVVVNAIASKKNVYGDFVSMLVWKCDVEGNYPISAKIKLEIKMTTDSAQLFVQTMREDIGFRETLKKIGDRIEFWEYIENNGYDFNVCDLVKAMAACMVELEDAG